MQHYKLGEYLRKRYSSLLGNGAYKRTKAYIRSTDVDRVLMSAEACLAGLYPPSREQVWNDKFDWQPIPVHTVQLADDYLVASEKRCDHFDFVMLQYMNTSAYTDIFRNYKSLVTYLEMNSGKKLPSITEIANLYDTLFIDRLKGLRLPDWAERVMVAGGDFEYIAFSWYSLFTATTEMKKIKSGYLLKEILDRFTNKTQRTLSPNRSIWMYFAHDITIANMLNSLGLFELHIPPYASCLFFELYQGHGKPYIQLFYRKSSKNSHPAPLNIPGCGIKCPLPSMYQLYRHILPTRRFDNECKLRDGETLPAGGNPENNSL